MKISSVLILLLFVSALLLPSLADQGRERHRAKASLATSNSKSVKRNMQSEILRSSREPSQKSLKDDAPTIVWTGAKPPPGSVLALLTPTSTLIVDGVFESNFFFRCLVYKTDVHGPLLAHSMWTQANLASDSFACALEPANTPYNATDVVVLVVEEADTFTGTNSRIVPAQGLSSTTYRLSGKGAVSNVSSASAAPGEIFPGITVVKVTGNFNLRAHYGCSLQGTDQPWLVAKPVSYRKPVVASEIECTVPLFSKPYLAKQTEVRLFVLQASDAFGTDAVEIPTDTAGTFRAAESFKDVAANGDVVFPGKTSVVVTGFFDLDAEYKCEFTNSKGRSLAKVDASDKPTRSVNGSSTISCMLPLQDFDSGMEIALKAYRKTGELEIGGTDAGQALRFPEVSLATLQQGAARTITFAIPTSDEDKNLSPPKIEIEIPTQRPAQAAAVTYHSIGKHEFGKGLFEDAKNPNEFPFGSHTYLDASFEVSFVDAQENRLPSSALPAPVVIKLHLGTYPAASAYLNHGDKMFLAFYDVTEKKWIYAHESCGDPGPDAPPRRSFDPSTKVLTIYACHFTQFALFYDTFNPLWPVLLIVCAGIMLFGFIKLDAFAMCRKKSGKEVSFADVEANEKTPIVRVDPASPLPAQRSCTHPANAAIGASANPATATSAEPAAVLSPLATPGAEKQKIDTPAGSPAPSSTDTYDTNFTEELRGVSSRNTTPTSLSGGDDPSEQVSSSTSQKDAQVVIAPRIREVAAFEDEAEDDEDEMHDANEETSLLYAHK